MSAEISLSLSLSASKNGASVSGSVATTQDMAGSDLASFTQYFNDTPELINIGDVDTPPAYIFVKNIETEGDIILSRNSDGSQEVSTIKAGKAVLLAPSSGQNTYIRSANTTPRRGHIVAIEA